MRGFCSAAGVTIPPETVDLVPTTAFSKLIRERGCDDRNTLLQVRESLAIPPPQITPIKNLEEMIDERPGHPGPARVRSGLATNGSPWYGKLA